MVLFFNECMRSHWLMINSAWAEPESGIEKDQPLHFSIRRMVKTPILLMALVGVSVVAVACATSSEESSDRDQAPTPIPTATTAAPAPTSTTEPVTTDPTAVPATPVDPTPTNPAPTSTATSVAPTVTSTAIPVPDATATPIPPTAVPTVEPTPFSGSTVELIAIKDNTLYQSSSGTKSNGAGEGLFAGKTNGGQLRRALVQFDLTESVPAGATIHSVELVLTLTKTATGSRPVAVHRVTSEWGEGTSDAAQEEGQGADAVPGDATWIHRVSPDQEWQTPGGDFAATPSAQLNVPFNGTYTWQSTSQLVADVQGWVDDPNSNFGWLLAGDEFESKSAKRFGSRENSNASAKPKLVIQLTPAS